MAPSVSPDPSGVPRFRWRQNAEGRRQKAVRTVAAVAPPDGEQVEAAGGVVWRQADGGEVEVLVVHRPRYDDWSFPKGKLDRGETHEAAAWREVWEETGFECALGDELAEVRYADRFGRPKRVRYWAMQVTGGEFTPNDEVDDLRWVSTDEAAGLLSYAHDAAPLRDVERLSSSGP
jgi:8-oxo-dGTP pyrophosphatase MutT (NUDIX family)